MVTRGEYAGVVGELICIDGPDAVIKEANENFKMVDYVLLASMPPTEHDQVRVIAGPDVGVVGELVCIDGDDAIIKESNENFKIVDFVYLARTARRSA